jgi:hypothetical protein
MSPFQRRVRAAVYAWFGDQPGPPTIADLAATLAERREDVAGALRALTDAHCLVLNRDGEVWMAHPFSAVETDCVVRVGTRRWFANRFEEEWAREDPATVAAALARHGLTGPFWALAGEVG